MKQIIDFNHISEEIPKDQRDQLISYFKTYHKKLYCAKKANKYYGRFIKLIFYTPLILTTSGIISAGSLFNPFLLILSAAGIFINTGFKRLEPKLEHKKASCKLATVVYSKILLQLQAYIRGKQYDITGLIHELQTKEDLLIDIVSGRTSKYEAGYTKKYV